MQRIKLANGIRAVIENIPYLHSASIGVWVLAGSRYEKAEENGISHFIEHMLFKGTSKGECLTPLRLKNAPVFTSI